MKRKGQVTIFIIIAIVIVVSVGAYFAFRGSIGGEDALLSDIEPYKVYMDDCIEKASWDVVYQVGEGGGYYFPPESANEDGFTYYYKEGKQYFPSIKEIENEISSYIASDVIICSNNFNGLSGFDISRGKIEVEVEVLEESINVNVNYPITFAKGEDSVVISKFDEVQIPVRLGVIHFGIFSLIQEGYYDEKEICIGCLMDLAEEKNLYFEVQRYENSSDKMFIILDENNERLDIPFRYIFINKLMMALI